MKPGGGKAKGNAFEASVAKLLSKHLAPLNFVRTQSSGARVGGKNFGTIGQLFGEDALKLFVGDVVPVNERAVGLRFRFSVECKFYKTPDSFPALVAGTANIFKWFNEARVDAEKVDKEPALIFKWNNTRIFVAMPLQPAPTVDLRRVIISDGSSTERLLAVYDLQALLQFPTFWYASSS
jgi:hypothetical protein